jgi:anti-sigma B factor antagonist
MDIRERSLGVVTILDLSGRMVLDDDESDRRLADAVANVLAQGCRHIVVNLARVTQMDTSGLTALVRAHVAVVRRGARIKFVEPPPRIREVLKTTRLDALFDVSQTERDALETFGPEVKVET